MSFELAFTSVDLLKIDAEGFELEVLRGAAELLRQRRVRSIFAECRFARTQANQVLFEDLDRTLVAAGFLFSGFYQFFRWGPSKAYAGFANGLWILEK